MYSGTPQQGKHIIQGQNLGAAKHSKQPPVDSPGVRESTHFYTTLSAITTLSHPQSGSDLPR